ncbi:MAG: HPP family protein [Halobacteria archaeon]
MTSLVTRIREWFSRPNKFHLFTGMMAALILVSFVTELGRSFDFNMFLVAPLASGTFTLFYNPEGEFASVRKFVGGLTLGAFSGYVSLLILGSAGSTAFMALALTGSLIWVTKTVEPTAFTAAHLALVTGDASFKYVFGIFVATSIIGFCFYVWKTKVYDKRASYLYESTWSDDNVLVPMVGEYEYDLVEIGSKIAEAHEGGRVVLLKVVEDSDLDVSDELEELSEQVRQEFDVFLEVSVVEGNRSDPEVVRNAANRYDCDIVVAPWHAEESQAGGKDNDGMIQLSAYIRKLFKADFDVAVYRPAGDEITDIGGVVDRGWDSVVTPVKKVNSLAFLIVDIGTRLAGEDGVVTVSRAIGKNEKRNAVQDELFNLTNSFRGRFETRVASVSGTSAREFIVRESREYDMMVIGASSGLGIASRFLKTPTVELIAEDIDIPVVVVNKPESSKILTKDLFRLRTKN